MDIVSATDEELVLYAQKGCRESFAELVRRYRKPLAIGFVLMVIGRAAGLVLPITSKYVVDEVAVGDYVSVHVGYALTRLDPDEAARTLALMAEAGIDVGGATAHP